MADNAQTNWNVVKIVYGSGDPSVKMVDKEHTYLFHWTQSFDKHTKQLIKLELSTRFFATNIRMPHPLGMLIIIMF
jgi:hypothetical protein